MNTLVLFLFTYQSQSLVGLKEEFLRNCKKILDFPSKNARGFLNSFSACADYHQRSITTPSGETNYHHSFQIFP